MGSIIPIGIKKVEVINTDNGNEQTVDVIYTASDSSTCTLRVKLGKESATVMLRDETLGEGSNADELEVRVQRETNDRGGGLIVTYDGNIDDIIARADARVFLIGFPKLLFGPMFVSRHKTATRGDTLVVSFMFGKRSVGQVYALAVQVWWDSDNGTFMHALSGPTLHTSRLEALLTMAKAYPSNGAVASPFTGELKTTNPKTAFIKNFTRGLKNDFAGDIEGNFNGAIVNFFHSFYHLMN